MKTRLSVVATRLSFVVGLMIATLGIYLQLIVQITPVYGQQCPPLVAVSSTANSGANTLRDAILTICPDGTISFDESLAGSTIDLTATLNVTQPMTIESTVPVTVSGQSVLRVFSLESSSEGTVRMSGFTIANGNAGLANGGGIENIGFSLELENMAFVGNSSALEGGALSTSKSDNGSIIAFAGAPFLTTNNTDTVNLTVSNSTFIDNLASNGGAISSQITGTVLIEDSLFVDNESTSNGGAYTGNAATIQNSRFIENVGANGGAIAVNAEIEINETHFEGNTATRGGAIANIDGTATVSGSSFSENQATSDGGAIYTSEGNQTLISNSTIYSNAVSTGNGGGISNGFNATLTLTQVTLSDNGASGDGGNLFNDGNASLVNTIMANHAGGGDCITGTFGTVVSAQNNLIESTTSDCGLATETDDIKGNLVGSDPRLSPFAENGGNTPTMVPSIMSEAINAGAESPCLPTDQRGISRLTNGPCDIGAVELELGNAVIDLALIPAPAVISDTAQYLLTLTNTGKISVTSLTVEANPPAAGEYINSSISGGDSQNDSDPASLLWTIDALVPSETITLTFDILVPLNTSIETELIAKATVTTTSPEVSADDNAAELISGVLERTFSISDAEIEEGDSGRSTLNFIVSRTDNRVAGAVDVLFTPLSADLLDLDLGMTQTVTFDVDGVFTKTVSIDILGDDVVEADDTFLATLLNPIGGFLGEATATGTIRNDDTATLSINGGEVLEGDTGTAQLPFTVTLDAPVYLDVTVDVNFGDGSATVADGDYQQQAATSVTIPAGSTSSTVSLAINGDTAFEPDETVIGSLSNARLGGVSDPNRLTIGATLIGAGVILDDDRVNISLVGSAVITEGDGTDATLPVTVTLDREANVPVEVTLSTVLGTASASDLTQVSNEKITLPAGTLSQVFELTIKGDDLIEANETFSVTLSNPLFNGLANSPQVGLRDETLVVTIINDDVAQIGFVESSVTVNEQNSSVDFEIEIKLDQPALDPVSVDITIADGSAIGGEDFTAVNQTVRILAGQSSATFVIPISADDVTEENETFEISLSNPINGEIDAANSTLTVTIVDVSVPAQSGLIIYLPIVTIE